MSGKRLRPPRYMVHWKARVLTPDKKIYPGLIKEIMRTGFNLEFHQALPLDSTLNIEFTFKYRGEAVKVRARTNVEYCLILANNGGVEIDLSINTIASEHQHILNNVMQTFANASNINLRTE